jgi:hypothetical protein
VFGEHTVDLRAIPGQTATKMAFNIVKQYFGTAYLKTRLVEPSGKSLKLPMSPQKVIFLKGNTLTNLVASTAHAYSCTICFRSYTTKISECLLGSGEGGVKPIRKRLKFVSNVKGILNHLYTFDIKRFKILAILGMK